MAYPTFVDLFSGAGLFSRGFVTAGLRPAGAVELNPFAVESYRRNVGEHVVRGSVRDHAPAGAVDVVIAGPPCQGFSTLGRRDPKDERNVLCLEVVRWARLGDAKVVVVENVPPFIVSPQWTRMTRALRRLGMTVETWELDAYDFGVPQRRRRSFTIASRIGEIGTPRGRRPGGNAGTAFNRLPALPWPDGDGDPGEFWKGEGNPWREALREFGGLMGGPGCGDVAAWMVLGGADRGGTLDSDRATFLAALWLSGRDAEHWGPNIRAALEASAHPALRRAGESWFPASAADEARGIVALSRQGGGEFRRAGRLAAEFLRSRRDHQYERVEIVLPEPIPPPSVPDTPRPVGAAP